MSTAARTGRLVSGRAEAFDYARYGLVASRRIAIPGGRPQTVGELLDRNVAAHPDRIALVGRNGRFTYRELDVVATRAAHALEALGIERGDRVAVSLPNDVDIVIAFLATMRIGAIWVGVNLSLAHEEKVYILRDSGTSVLLAAGEVARTIRRAEPIGLREVVAVSPGSVDDEWRGKLAAMPGTGLEARVDAWEPAAIAYTSGTSGFPKGAVHSQHNILLPGAVNAAESRYPADAPQGVVLPLTILNVMVLGPITAFQDGTACVAIDRIDPVGLAQWVRDEKVASFGAVPTVFHDLLTHPDVKPSDLATLRKPVVGGSECPEEFRTLFRERFGHDVAIAYGMTEAPTAVALADGEPASEPGYCGRAAAQCEILIQDEHGTQLSDGSMGEIVVGPARTGPWAGAYTPMLGYWNQAEASRAVLRGGYYHTGDVGLLEANGRLFIRGRRSELILRGGANVYPAEVERVLREHPAVEEAAVLGVPDRRLGQRVVAVVRVTPDPSTTPVALREYCREKLARYKVPDRIEVVDRLPRNAMAKVVKRELAALFEGDLVDR